MIIIKANLEQPDLFKPEIEPAYVVKTENLIYGNKTIMRVLPHNLDRYKDKVTRTELAFTVTRMVNARHNTYSYVGSSDSFQYKWDAVKQLTDLLPNLSVYKTAYALCVYISNILMYRLEVITPGKSSSHHKNYVKNLSDLKVFINQQILAHQRARKVVHFKEKAPRV